MGASPVHRSTLSDANRQRSPAVFTGRFNHLVGRINQALRRQTKACEAVYLIDFSSLPLKRLSGWAEFSAQCHRAKMHVVYDAGTGIPVYLSVSDAGTNDITAAKVLPITHGVTYVMDLGYYDFAWWAKFDAAHCRIVTRFKSNTPLAMVQDLELQPGSAVLSGRIGLLPIRMAHSRRNPMGDAVREVCGFQRKPPTYSDLMPPTVLR